MQEISKRIAKTLKSLRQERGWSLDRTALETGVSKAMLGQIEREESSPTIATLWKIASGFQTSFSSFIEDTLDSSANPIHRIGNAQTLHPADQKIRVFPLFPFDEQLYFELFVIELLPGCEHFSPPHKYGVIEHVIVIEGVIDVWLNGCWKTLCQGEGFRFNASQTHGYRNTTHHVSRIHDIIHYPPQ
ncbi:helix-turn-helix domain-containing protein [Legionella longbeachae]|uniref:Putative DNA-binding transcriptional regulator n=1 Tax=Legionella longbeachae serogroup 1 (strain NSW150) TaxID=661367 RepID=D3HQZ8_LEGLN|nr:XRE family transcriptional regulator [Legionella longbeachae]VEE01833.1 DNA-binding transcriptional regulator [Legionella oakridgensis]HBD7399358.1 helix-turn-helix transcriptional regulator [Legionella pneumophila]ARB91849.1 XRE family transcriptional regulator [Legionella longbeachae]ARM35007.1 helix-turn-helix domain-containing protein [Legionella longbeachae]EEZ95579.1 putative transcriptional regulator [Legionella longbeachae D-4968]